MEYTILRQEIEKSLTNEDEMFLQLEIATEDDVFNKALWLPTADVKAILADETAIDTIATRISTRAVIARKKQLSDESKAHDLSIAELVLKTAEATKVTI